MDPLSVAQRSRFTYHKERWTDERQVGEGGFISQFSAYKKNMNIAIRDRKFVSCSVSEINNKLLNTVYYKKNDNKVFPLFCLSSFVCL